MASRLRLADGTCLVKCRVNGVEHRIRLGRVTEPALDRAKAHVTDLVATHAAGLPPHPATAKWINSLPPKVYKRLAKTGLIIARDEKQAHTIAGLCQLYIERKARDCKKTSLDAYQKPVHNLETYFGPNSPIRSVTADEAREFRHWLSTAANRRTDGGLAPTTVAKRCKAAREVFQIAVRKRWIDENPFGELRGLDISSNPKRQVYVERSIIERLIDDTPSNEWKLWLSLWRFAGLRQLEPLELTWSDIHWAQRRMTVTATKQVSEHKRRRTIPIWPEVERHLSRQYESAGEGEKWVIFENRYRYDTNKASRATGSSIYSRLKTHLYKLGIPPWPKLTQNLRSSGETDAERTGKWKQWEIAYWWNHTKRVQEDHYLTITDAAYDLAHPAESTESSEKTID